MEKTITDISSKREANKDVVEALERLLELARKGEVNHLMWAAIKPGTVIDYGWTDGTRMSDLGFMVSTLQAETFAALAGV